MLCLDFLINTQLLCLYGIPEGINYCLLSSSLALIARIN